MRSSLTLVIAVLTLLPSPAPAAEMRIERDISYAEPKSERNTLDVYAPPSGKNLPVVFWIHGGGWRRGDKAGVALKPAAFTERGFVFVSTNYRFYPEVGIKEMTADVAKAIRWTHEHTAEYGGDPNKIYVFGHSAGAHLAALVCTDDRYLKAEGLSLKILRGCVPIDVSVYDIPWRLDDSGGPPNANFNALFTDDPQTQADLSPQTHVAAGKDIPPFLLLYVADRPETKAASQRFADALTNAGVKAELVAGENKTHTSIANDLGKPDDAVTAEVYRFLGAKP